MAPNVYTAPSGFSREQFLLVDRLRDQVFTLSEQLRETRRQLDYFDTEVKKHEKSRRPRSLAAAQIEFSVDKLIAGTDEDREQLEKKRTAVHILKEKNDELRARLLKFTTTKKTLTDEANAVLNDRNEEKVELDRKVSNTQERLLRLQSEVEDNSRLLATVKSLTEKTEDELQQEKSQLHVAVTELSASEVKLAATQEKYMTETATRDTLAAKVASLEENIKELHAEKEVKDRQLETKKRKLESDRLHFAQVVDDERKQSVMELRDVRQQLVADLAARDERFQAAKERAAAEAYERGRSQGRQDGEAEAFMEGDLKAQQLTITVQRLRAEEDAMRMRLRAAVEERAQDERQLLAQMKAPRQTVEQMQKENAQLAEEAHSLRLTTEAAEREAYTDLEEALRSTTVPISQRALFVLLDNLNNRTSFDRSVLQRDAAEQQRVLQEDYAAVVNWVRTTAYNQPHACPPLRPLFFMDKPLAAANMGRDLFVANVRVSEESGSAGALER
ncbi:hypothetical protein STCU_10595 [Strigomonas culicis]|uniref:FK506-binding protein 15-like domain-containing protein n=1 Tax=Strigomonas culicis TaxID=28005 RepID=S9THD5_9TRYP|nr:hypothetical protein STCU_10595 [Strigomonas culicis]|eukprot:EPY17472.1 hypothetical protein STCU_10595 [Strigomonas culicis]